MLMTSRGYITPLAAVIVIALIILASILGITWYQSSPQQRVVLDDLAALPSLDELLDDPRRIITPPPLRGPDQPHAGTLTQGGILQETNAHRQVAGQAPLTANTLLNRAAAQKLQDMFAQQYFEHVGPDGKGPADWVEGVGYEYIRVGENLALGNFGSDVALVQAWMDSPGHRENILHEKFSEIGIAAAPGTFEGQRTWLAVQTFALPLGTCPLPDESLRTQLEQIEAETAALSATLDQARQEIESQEDSLAQELTAIEALIARAEATIAAGNAKIEEGNKIYQETGSREQAQPYWDEGQRLQAEGEALVDQARQQQTAYNQAVRVLQEQQRIYNEQVTILNSKIEAAKALMTRLNQQVQQFNACLE
ncbi:MAG: CAP domain-containing protein [Candidatus Andersenbacteria bacterium]